MPWLLAGALSYFSYTFAVKKGWINPLISKPVTIPVQIDTYAPSQVETVVVTAISQSNDPNALMNLANQIVMYFPNAAYTLQHRAWQIMGGASSGQPEPQPPTPAAQQAALTAYQAAIAAPQVPPAPPAAPPVAPTSPDAPPAPAATPPVQTAGANVIAEIAVPVPANGAAIVSPASP